MRDITTLSLSRILYIKQRIIVILKSYKMKILKISVIIAVLVSSPFLFLIYDLASFDKNYLNRNVIYFNKTNLNSKKSKEFYSLIEKIYYKTI